MYCFRCGKQIPDGSRTCNNCGATQPPQQPMQYRQAPPPQYRPQQAPPKKSVSPIIAIGVIFFSLLAFLLLFLEGNSSKKTPEPTPDPVEITTEKTTEAASSEATQGESVEGTEPETLKKITSVTMTGHHLAQNSIGDNILVVDYDFYNGEDEPTSFSWACTDQCFQNGVECSTFVFLDEVDTHKQTADVQPGVTLSLSVCYKLDDMSDVNIVVKELIGDREYVNQTFSPQS